MYRQQTKWPENAIPLNYTQHKQISTLSFVLHFSLMLADSRLVYVSFQSCSACVGLNVMLTIPSRASHAAPKHTLKKIRDYRLNIHVFSHFIFHKVYREHVTKIIYNRCLLFGGSLGFRGHTKINLIR